MNEDSPNDNKKKGSSDKEILEDAREELRVCIEDEEQGRRDMLDDLRFCALDQWPEDIRKERENDIENGPRPCLTIDKINQYIVQVVNDVRQGKPGINVRPQDDAADIETAKVLKGLVRNIEDQSSADISYATAVESAAKIGLGFFRITTEYVSADSFDQDIFVRPIPNTFSTYLGRHIMPDGSDAQCGFIVEAMGEDKFKLLYPKAKSDAKEFDGISEDERGYWRTEGTVTVIEYFWIEETAEELLFLQDGTTMSSTDYERWPDGVPKPAIQDRRTNLRKQLRWVKMTGIEILDKRDLPGQYIPIVEVIGREAHVDGKRLLWGLVRPAKDSLRMYNYWASTLTEKFGLSPRTPFIGAKGQFKGVEERWKKANRVNYSYLEYDPVEINGNALPRPERQGPTPMEAAYFHQMQVIEHDVQTALGMFKAAVGETESQQSGRAILALQRESDTGTYHFGANLGISIRHAGRIIVDMIPHYYDTKRIVRILGEDGESQSVQLDPSQEVAYREIKDVTGAIQRIHNPGVGKYDVSITVGPSYNTKRMEAAATFVEMAKGAADPASAAVLRYLTVRNSDFQGSDESSRMLKALLPPPALQAIAPGNQDIPPQAQAQIAHLTQTVQMMQQKGAELTQENQQLKAHTQEGMAKVAAAHDAKLAEIALEREAQMAQLALEREVQAEQLRLAREKAEAEILLKQAIAEADHGIEQKKLAFQQECRAQDIAIKNAQDTQAVAGTPQHVETTKAMEQRFQQLLSAHQDLKKQLAEPAKPKTITYNVSRGTDGRISGGTATVH